MSCDPAKILSVIGNQSTVGSPAKRVRLLQYPVEHRRGVARRGIDDLQDLRHRGFLSLAFVALGNCLIEPPLQVSVSALKIAYRLIDRRGHLFIPSGRGHGTTGLYSIPACDREQSFIR